jgi:hypothetical protein
MLDRIDSCSRHVKNIAIIGKYIVVGALIGWAYFLVHQVLFEISLHALLSELLGL